ncbi:hypothetical protein M427DRAFT_123869 [Gonapodya prolifera JEL478]|uniref:Uncharacterized protein n=1 Tax=Gonapodya prolifera (strain JEL478) TaxID=1344416 RepID=A0A139AED2_GONPJ|nr:hypothetical protein M427DRAFT_123869 [Gonapodya prolifera JEL478]|eukprot:KXS15172.1 hypothetical protein M427DRAFT_123869 [Gonapodya prolifera JEL478]
MFVLSVIRDIIRVPPVQFAQPRNDAITHQINDKYANRVLHNVGLCIRVFDLLEVGDPIVHAVADGSYSCPTKFRLVVFRPFIDEILHGRVHSQGEWGLRITMGFFDDITVPKNCFPQGTRYDAKTSKWIWVPPDGDPDDPDWQYPFGHNDHMRFRVLAEKFDDGGQVVERAGGVAAGGGAGPPGGGAGAGAGGGAGAGAGAGEAAALAMVGGVVGQDGAAVVRPYALTATMDDELGGLGNPAWFASAAEEEEGGDAMEM